MVRHVAWPARQPLELEHVRFRRGGNEVLRGVNLRFDPDQRYVVIGASGSGKSTLVRLLNRLDDPDSGVIRVGATPLATLPVLAVRRAVSLVFQSPRPLPGTLRDNLDAPAQFAGKPPRQVAEHRRELAEVGLDPDWMDRDAAGLSGGERQRLAIAVALGTHPEILVLDEPTAALDPASARTVADLLDRRSRSDGLRTIVVTHDRGLASRMGNIGIRFESGVVADAGPIADVIHRAEFAEQAR